MPAFTTYSLLLLNGGVGSRIGANRPKQFLKIGGVPILVYPLAVIDKIPEIAEIVLNFPPGERESVESIIKSYAIKTPVTLVEAGETRHDSVAAMLPHASHEHVIVHEAARPLVTTQDFYALINSEHDNVSLMAPISFTVAPVDPETNRVTGSLERDRLRNVQLPQKFAKADLAHAHSEAAAQGAVFTEDATLVTQFGRDVFFIEGHPRNIKVTTPVDLQIANYLLSAEEQHD